MSYLFDKNLFSFASVLLILELLSGCHSTQSRPPIPLEAGALRSEMTQVSLDASSSLNEGHSQEANFFSMSHFEIRGLASWGEEVLVATRENGLFLITQQGQILEHLTLEFPIINSLTVKRAQIFVSTDQGIFIKRGAHPFVHFSLAEDGETELPVNQVYFDSNRGIVYAATLVGLCVFRFQDALDFRNNEVEFLYDYPLVEASSVFVNNSQIFIGTADGLYFLDRLGVQPEFYSEHLRGQTISTIFVNGLQVWVGTRNGLDVFDQNRGRSRIISGLGINSFYSKNGVIFISTDQGIKYTRNGESDQFDDLLSEFENITSILHHNEILYVGTRSGLLRFHLPFTTTSEWMRGFFSFQSVLFER